VDIKVLKKSFVISGEWGGALFADFGEMFGTTSSEKKDMMSPVSRRTSEGREFKEQKRGCYLAEYVLVQGKCEKKGWWPPIL